MVLATYQDSVLLLVSSTTAAVNRQCEVHLVTKPIHVLNTIYYSNTKREREGKGGRVQERKGGGEGVRGERDQGREKGKQRQKKKLKMTNALSFTFSL